MDAQKRINIFLLAMCACIFLCACSKSEEATRVDKLVENIGEITLDSESKIIEAEEAVANLSEEDYRQLDQVKHLEEARSQYDNLLAEELERKHQEKISEVETAISQIGVVTLESGESIATARRLYDLCTQETKERISNYDLLSKAEVTFSDLSVAEVSDLISEIGTVSPESSDQIYKAKGKYVLLSSADKERVENLQLLLDAEAAYAKLKSEADQQAAIEKARSIIRVKKIWCSNQDSAGGVELYFNFTNNSEKTIKYVNFGATFYNAVGDVVTCRISDDVVNYCHDTGPYEKGEGLNGSDWYWGKYYSWDIKTVKLVYLSVEYMDGTSITLSDDELEYVQY